MPVISIMTEIMEMDVMIDNMKILDKKQIIITLILLVGLVTTIILVRNPQIFKSRADERVYNHIQVKGANCNGNNCDIQQANTTVKFRLNLEEIENLKNQ